MHSEVVGCYVIEVEGNMVGVGLVKAAFGVSSARWNQIQPASAAAPPRSAFICNLVNLHKPLICHHIDNKCCLNPHISQNTLFIFVLVLK